MMQVPAHRVGGYSEHRRDFGAGIPVDFEHNHNCPLTRRQLTNGRGESRAKLAGLGVPVRVAAVLPERSRMAYYAAAFALGLLCRARPGATPWVGMLESTTNLLILFLSILLPIWGAADALATGAPLAVSLTPLSAANAFISGSAMILSFRRSQDASMTPRS